MLLTLVSIAMAGPPVPPDECDRFKPPDNIALTTQQAIKANIKLGAQVLTGEIGGSSDAAATYVAQQRSQSATDKALQKYELCLARQSGMLTPWDYCMQVKTIFGGLDTPMAATRCDQEAAAVAPTAALVAVAPPTSTTSPPSATAWRHRTPLLVGTALSAVGASVLYSLAAGEHARFASSPTMTQSEADASGYEADLNGIQSRANAYSYGAYGAAGLGLVLGIGAVITW